MKNTNKEKLQEHYELLLEQAKDAPSEELLELTRAIIAVYSLLSSDANFL